jgi:CheY-like chemotaxis protein
MSSTTTRRKQFLFVDDDADFLVGLRALFTEMARGSWEIFTAESHAQALTLLQQQRVDVVVLDIGMPIMDGLQFLRLLGRTHPGLQIVMLTGRATPEARKTSIEGGAALVLEKPISAEGFGAVFAALDALADSQPHTGFRGVMRRVGLQEVLQIECLSRRSSILEISTGKMRGRIFIEVGSVIHAESGPLQGEAALYGLLALEGGDFNLLPFVEPLRRTIQAHWESLLMEAARLCDEGAALKTAAAAKAPEAPPAVSDAESHAAPSAPVGVEETLLCSGAGEVLYDWQCKAIEARKRLLEQVEQQASEVSAVASVGRFERLEIQANEGRIVCQIAPHIRMFVRSVPAPGHGSP